MSREIAYMIPDLTEIVVRPGKTSFRFVSGPATTDSIVDKAYSMAQDLRVRRVLVEAPGPEDLPQAGSLTITWYLEWKHDQVEPPPTLIPLPLECRN